MVNVGTGKSGTRFINKNYPVDDGLTAGTTTQKGHKENLEYEEGTTVLRKEKEGL
jgi:hypothetical protein